MVKGYILALEREAAWSMIIATLTCQFAPMRKKEKLAPMQTDVKLLMHRAAVVG